MRKHACRHQRRAPWLQATDVRSAPPLLLALLGRQQRTVFSECIQQLERAGWREIMYGKIEIKGLETWRRFINAQSQRVWNDSNPSIDRLVTVLDQLSLRYGQP